MIRIGEILKQSEKLMQPSRMSLSYKINEIDEDQRLVTGVVYSPWSLDSHGHYMSDKEVQKTAHAFMARGLQRNIDVMHDNEVIDAVIVESYIERIGSPEVPVGSWVATTKIEDSVVWARIKNGELNGYSMEIMSYLIEHEAEITYESWVFGETQPDPFDGHTHMFMIKMNEEGDIEYGYTSVGGEDNHIHTISALSVTDPYNNVTHRLIF